MAPVKPTAHVSAATEPIIVLTHTTESIPIAACGGERKRVSSQSPSESGNHSQSDRGLTQHCTYSFGRDRVHLSENTVTTVRFDCANPIDDYAARGSATFSSRYARFFRSGKPARHVPRVRSQIMKDKSSLKFF